VRPERTDPDGWIAHRPDSPTNGEGKDDHLYYFPTAPILGNGSPKVEMTLQGRTTTMLLDTGADISVLPRDLMVELVPHHAHACRLRTVQSFGGAYLTIEGPQYLTVEFCGLKAVHPFYALDSPTPPVVGCDFMEAFRLIIDLKHSCVASHYNRREPFSLPKSLHPLRDATVPPASDDTQLAPQANARINLTSVSERATSSSHTDR